jgi:hypothetical protein
MARFSTISSTTDRAILAVSVGEGVHAETSSAAKAAAIVGIQLDGSTTSSGAGVSGECRGGGAGVLGIQSNPAGAGSGVHGETLGLGNAIEGFQNNSNSGGAAIFGKHISGGTAGFFDGNVIVTGDVSFPGADCAEEFAIQAEAVAGPGTVMALSETGELVPCSAPYEKKVVGVIAGAGSLRPGIIMGRQHGGANRQPIALVGTVYCNADARPAPIAVGDLLTSSATKGHAMKASDPARAFGAVIGKAMAPLREDTGLIPILIALQ